MKYTKRFTALVLCLALLLSAFGAGCKGGASSQSQVTETNQYMELFGDGITYAFTPLSAGDARYLRDDAVGLVYGRTNDILLYDNPDRGYRTTMPIVMYDLHPDPEDPSKFSDTCDLIKRDDKGKVSLNKNSKCTHDVRRVYTNLDEQTREKVLDYMFQNIYFKNVKTDYEEKLILVQIQLTSWAKTKVLPDEVFDVIQTFLDKCAARGVKVLFRLGYHMVQVNWTVSEENRKLQEAAGASEEVMLAHIEQLIPFITKNAPYLHKLSMGFIGSGGEMAYNYQYPVVNYDTIIKAVVEKLALPNGLFYTCGVRWKSELLEHDPDYIYGNLIGYSCDSVFGEVANYGWGGGCFKPYHNFDATKPGMCYDADHGGIHFKNDWWNFISETAAYTPQSGEMFHDSSTTGKNQETSGFDMIKQLAHHRYTTLSQWNSYNESGNFESERNSDGKLVAAHSVMQNWIDDEVVTEEWLQQQGIIYDPAWFYDDEGNPVTRNPYEFIRDHLGYKIVAQELTLKDNKDIGGFDATMTLINYGFAAAFNLESGFMILDEDYNVVSSVKAGEPHKWYSHDPDAWESEIVLEHTVSAHLSFPNSSGKYYIAFYLRNTMEDYAKLSNQMPYEENRYNILYEFSI